MVLCWKTQLNTIIPTTLTFSLLLYWNKTELAVIPTFAWWSELQHAEGRIEDFYKLFHTKQQ